MKRVSSNDIARLAGVSRSTVSRVINGYSNVPEETYNRVMRVVRELHYYPQISGRQLCGKGSNTLGLFWIGEPNISQAQFSSNMFMFVVDAAAQRNYLTLADIVPNLSEEKYANHVRRVFSEGRIDAGIFIGASNAEPLMDELPEKGYIVGIHDYYRENDPQQLRLTSNYDRNSGEQIIDYLYSLGHRKIAILSGDLSHQSCLDRHESFLRGMVKHNLPIKNQWMGYGGYLLEPAYRGTMQMLGGCMSDLPTAICANNDTAARGVFRACTELGLRIPEDISVFGTDDEPAAAMVQPPLSTFMIDTRKLFFSLVNRVIDTLEGKENVPRTEFIEGTLMPRGSSAPPREKRPTPGE
jgi:LacI family transcriptional regulator